MAHQDPTLTDLLRASLDCPERIRAKARALGVVQRQGKVDAYALLVVVVLGVAVRGPTAIAQLGHVLAEVTGLRLARSSFWDRFTPSFASLVQWLLDGLVEKARRQPPRPPGVLGGFRDVIAVDATVVKLHDALEATWRGTRRNSAKAALKVHAWVRALTGELLKYRITADAHGDGRAFGIDHALRGCLVLLDKGYSSPSLWRRIDSVGGYFLTRLPRDRNPLVVAENRRHRGRSRKAKERPLREALAGLQRSLLDVDCDFRCHVRGYAGGRGRFVHETFRVVAVRDRSTGTYEVFVTNAPVDLLPAEAVAATYRLRWEVETFFKTSKSGSGLDELPSRQPEIVLALVYASLLRATASMQALARFRRVVAAPRGLPVNPGQWMKWWNRQLHRVADALVAPVADLDAVELARMLADPHVRRITNRERFSMVAYAA
jgi:hypothetical protein